MSITRGEFLKSLRKSIPGMVLGSGVAAAAQSVLSKMAAASSTGHPTLLPSDPKTISAPKIEFIKSGPAIGSRVALTFDDGPTPGVTDRILDELKKRNVRATFFMIGERIAAAPDLARRVLAEGHEIGNHTYTHPKLTEVSDAQVAAEIQKTNDIMREVLDHRPVWFRPPFGALHRSQAPLIGMKGLGIVLFSVDPKDWSQPGETKIVETILTESKPGSILLCHDVHPQTANSVESILDGLSERGLIASTLSEVLG
jgi:peptidoglycan/xylan/chitin deacetylase (PgdA/CDA1 family)